VGGIDEMLGHRIGLKRGGANAADGIVQWKGNDRTQ